MASLHSRTVNFPSLLCTFVLSQKLSSRSFDTKTELSLQRWLFMTLSYTKYISTAFLIVVWSLIKERHIYWLLIRDKYKNVAKIIVQLYTNVEYPNVCTCINPTSGHTSVCLMFSQKPCQCFRNVVYISKTENCESKNLRNNTKISVYKFINNYIPSKMATQHV